MTGTYVEEMWKEECRTLTRRVRELLSENAALAAEVQRLMVVGLSPTSLASEVQDDPRTTQPGRTSHDPTVDPHGEHTSPASGEPVHS